MLKRFFSSSLGRLSIWLVFLSLVLLTFVSYNKWNEIINEVHLELSGVLQMIKKSARDGFFQQEVMLKILGERLIEVGGLTNKKESKRIMDGLLRDNPVFVAYGLAAPNGELFITSANLEGKQLPNLLEAPQSAVTFRKALVSEDLTIGRTYFFKPLAEWIVPLRYAVRDKNKNVIMVITTAFKLDGEHNPWATEFLKEDVDIHIPHDSDVSGNYYPIYFAPFELLSLSKEKFYNNPLPKSFIDTAITRMEESSGMELKEIKKSEAIVSYINDAPGIIPGYTVLSYDSKYNYFVVTRQKLPTIYNKYAQHVAVYTLLFLIFNLFMFLMLYRMFKVDENLKENLEHQALHDQLTNLPNRYYLKKCFSNWISKSHEAIALLFVDLDNFKFINDHFGHSIGDRVLIEMSRRLKKLCSDEMVVVRQGGDEFLLLTPYTEQSKLENIIEKLIYRIREVLIIDDIKTSLSASIGVACTDDKAESLESLLVKADLAMYEAKKLHNSFAFFSHNMQKKSNERAVIQTALHSALKHDEMYMVYQPQVDATDGGIIGVEALIRWENPELGTVSPDKFISVAEACGQINEIGNFVIDTALKEFSSIYQQSKMRLSINVSVHQLTYGSFREHLNRKVQEYKLEPSNITIEVTESLFIEDFMIIDNLLRLIRSDGFGISLDDFGTGYSSLSVLGSLPINEVKIDKSFVRDMLTDTHDKALIESIIGIGHSLKIPTLAEGVETGEQATVLKEYGCTSFQGYYFAKPMDIESLHRYIGTYTPGKIASITELSVN